MPRAEAWFLFFITAALFYVAVNIQSGWLYVVDFALITFCLLSWLLPAIWIHGDIQIEHFFPKVFEGETMDALIRIGNPSSKNRYFLLIQEIAPSMASAISFFIPVLKKGTVREFAYQIKTQKWGVFQNPEVMIQSSGPSAFFVWKRKIASSGALVVYPRSAAFPFSFESVFPAPQTGDKGITLGKGTEGEFFGVRNYEAGDNLRSIHWPTTAKTGHLMVREMSRSHPGMCTLYIDCSQKIPPVIFEESIRLSAYAIQRIFEEGHVVRLFHRGLQNLNDRWISLEILAALQADESLPLARQVEASLPYLMAARHLLFFTALPAQFAPDSWMFVKRFRENFVKTSFVLIGHDKINHSEAQKLSDWLKNQGADVQTVFVPKAAA